ncbi:type IV conjugative transfer system lipoprotein TraV [Pseudomonas neustonica]|mgnify:CR=1 FL=1|uniref:type IV conjugative transfer system lipoprotein TraV n=1 Tax=Pseudomonas neustonica TaxID=2487346 RepID=UPI003F44D1CE|tara:strand:- start:1243 stop:1713 length:471 start_codon:yes stop_codon:yes gene_type:complete
MKNIITISALLALTGCTSMLNIGSPEYGCSGMPEGVTCVSARDVYTATETDAYKTQLMREQEGHAEGAGNAADASAEAGTRVLYREPGDNAPMPVRAQNPLPIRTQAVVMRIAVDPWEDKNGDLYVPGYIYTEIEPRRWEVGIRASQQHKVIRVLE